MRAFLVDDEALALKRLSRMLTATGRVEIVGSGSDPVEAVDAVLSAKPDVLFLDIEMPGMTGFEMLAKLDPQPVIVFTTAYDRYALQAFGVNSIDYLLKPIEQAQLDRALDKIERMRGGAEPRQEIRELLDRLSAAAAPQPEYPTRIASRKFVRIHRATLVNLDSVYDLHAMFAGRMLVRLKDEKRTELAVSRDRVKALKQRLGI